MGGKKYLVYGLILLLFGPVYSSQLSSQEINHSVHSSSGKNIFFPFIKTLKQGHLVFQAGGYWSYQGKDQHIDIAGLIGDRFTITNHKDSNALVGLGYFISDKNSMNISYGLNGFYLPSTSVSGEVIQEDLFTNLSYRYKVTHFPVYAVAKSTIPLYSNKSSLVLNVGIGPNFMYLSDFKERSIDDGVTLSDHAFLSHTRTTFSATAGIGFRLNQIFGNIPLECGYRFFYLGQGRFRPRTDQLLTSLSTGSTYANAVLCSISV
ncbi:hypothetical protein [Legionella drozanskii]|uniref:Outer membrane protein beta-barrel domain-containing protein n=1 Tax=Legionella drozanskii LLAP-1 TaxID=1212489 RepID=A0A0W0SWG4_9GAMM|nr:hypothetical protein [Legionella drozanskii]KTC87691.1 hypothetical protein Ldro_1310 [Legionella drozanskii LLAP-1]